MREIKFRAWDKDHNKMLNDIHEIWRLDNNSNFADNNNKKTHELRLGWYEDKKFAYWRDIIPSQIELMQFTGLKDRNQKEIYEGDIVERKYFHNNPPSKRPKVKYVLAKLPVVFDGGKFDLDDSEIRCTDYGTTFNNWWGDGCEIIGNIYESPDLLSKEQEVKECDTRDGDSKQKDD